MKPLIGVTAATILNYDRPYAPFTYGQMHTYTEAIEAAGGIPVILPISKDPEMAARLLERLDGVLFAGGEDVAPERYGEVPTYAGDVDVSRDEFEIRLMQATLERRMPLLGICRGMQLLNVVRGGTLYQDIETDLPDAQNHDGEITTRDVTHLAHKLVIDRESSLAAILEAVVAESNSHHHQAIKELGEGLTVSARTEDGIIEAVEDMRQGYVIGVQSHPESIERQVLPVWQKLFQSFVAAAKARE